ncbi:hypothetical protein ACFQO1_05255 [Jejudonia soesokkakensis]|uniref:Uncharacterized protein n=1 Tax=Jejudonia soesokkakensis TaxID=1323432 RepID=A0ABW2MS18_9FLAO
MISVRIDSFSVWKRNGFVTSKVILEGSMRFGSFGKLSTEEQSDLV